MPDLSQSTSPHMWTSRWKELKSEFEDNFDSFMHLLDHCDKPLGSDAMEYLHKLTNYNLSEGKRIRGTLVSAVVAACNSNKEDKKLYSQAHLTGWCIEMMHAGFLILDDIMDNSPTRRGRPSWFKVQLDAGLGMLAVNDGLQVVLTAKHMLSKIFSAEERDQVVFLQIVRIFDEVGYQTCFGQNLDTRYSLHRDHTKKKILDLHAFTRANFDKIAQWKTAYYTFHLPVACGMAIAGIKDSNVLAKTKNILLKMGEYFQAQDDYLDCFGDPNVTGKIGTDIEDGKCTWLIAECIDRASPEQINQIKHHYGQSEQSSVALIHELYTSLDLAQHFRHYEQEQRRIILHEIEKLQSLLEKSDFPDLLVFITDLLFGRSH